ncbi:hypothetical protein [Saccharothrix stipae]
MNAPTGELDGDTAEYLVRQVEQERADGTLAGMDGESAARWIAERLRYLARNTQGSSTSRTTGAGKPTGFPRGGRSRRYAGGPMPVG